MSDRVFVDTNILVYAYDRSEPDKQKRAVEVMDALVTTDNGVISTQVLAEFFISVTRKIKAPLSVAEAYQRLEALVQAWTVVELSSFVPLEAARGVRDYQFHFWDAQIWATARLSHVPLVLSEDFNTSSTIEGVRFENPLIPSFDLNQWL